jgi:hypothetical protein
MRAAGTALMRAAGTARAMRRAFGVNARLVFQQQPSPSPRILSCRWAAASAFETQTSLAHGSDLLSQGPLPRERLETDRADHRAAMQFQESDRHAVGFWTPPIFPL